MDLDYGDEVERCSSDPYGDHSARSLNDGLRAAPEMRRCYSLSQLGLLERAVFEMEDRSVRLGLPSVHHHCCLQHQQICISLFSRFASACSVESAALAPAREQCYNFSLTVALRFKNVMLEVQGQKRDCSRRMCE